MRPAAAATVVAGGPAFRLGVALVCGLMAWEWGSLVADLNGRGLARGVILGVSTLALGWMLLRGPYWGVGVGVAGAVGIVLAGRFMRLPQAPWLAVAVISIVLPWPRPPHCRRRPAACTNWPCR